MSTSTVRHIAVVAALAAGALFATAPARASGVRAAGARLLRSAAGVLPAAAGVLPARAGDRGTLGASRALRALESPPLPRWLA